MMKYIFILGLISPSVMAALAPIPDPGNYKALMLIYKQMVETYNATLKTLDKMEEIKSTVERAQSGVDAVKNMDIRDSFERINGGDKKGFDKVGELRRQLGKNGMAVRDQVDRFKDFQRLITLSDATKKNAANAAKGLNAGQSQSLTAQSTTVMAALAVEAADEKKKQELRQDKLSEDIISQMKAETKLYKAFEPQEKNKR